MSKYQLGTSPLETTLNDFTELFDYDDYYSLIVRTEVGLPTMVLFKREVILCFLLIYSGLR